jgi:hypothetical protein
MAEVGLNISREFPKPLTTDKVQAADVVITMGCGDTCPVFPGKRYLDWDLPDPAGLDLDVIRPIRDEISNRVQELLTELVPGDLYPVGVNLADFGMANYTNSVVTMSGVKGTLAAKSGHWTSYKTTMVNTGGGDTLAVPSSLEGGKAFNVTWQASQ